MNLNIIIALLERKGILTREEGEKLVEFINNKPQPTLLADAVSQIEELVSATAPKIEAVAKDAEKLAKDTAKEAEKLAKQVAKDAEAIGNSKTASQVTDTGEKK